MAKKIEQNIEAEEKAVLPQNFTIPGSDGLQLSPSSIATIIRKEILSVDGVVRLAPAGLVEGLADVFSDRNYERSIDLVFNANEVEVKLVLVLRYGCNIRDVVSKVQENVKNALSNMAGITVKTVNILVKELEEVSDDEDEADKE